MNKKIMTKQNKLTLIVATLLVSFNVYAETIAKASVTLNPIGSFVANTTKITGFAQKKGTQIIAENIIVDLKSLSTGISLRDKHAKEKYLEVNKFPTAVLVKAVGEKGKGSGTLKIRGVEKEVNGTYTIKDNFLTAKFPIQLSEYNISDISYKGVGVEDKVDLEITVPLK